MTVTARRCTGCRQDDGVDSQFPLGGSQRRMYGCIVSFESPDGQTLTLHVPGPPREAVRAALRAAQLRDPYLLVRSVSTPETVYRDLQGTRDRQVAGEVPIVDFPEFLMRVPPERLHPSLLSPTTSHRIGKRDE